MLSFSHRTISGKILCQIGNHIPSGLDTGRSPGETGGGGGVDAGGVVHEIGREGGAIAHLFIGQIPGELMDDGRDHLHVAKLFCPHK